MDTKEKELERFKPVIKVLTMVSLLGKKIAVKGKENLVKTGPNIIVANHIGSFKDVAVLFKIIPRPIFFSANKMLFTKEGLNFLIKKYTQINFGKLGAIFYAACFPSRELLVKFVTNNISKTGTIPVDLYSSRTNRNKLLFKKWKEYLLNDKVVVVLQGRGTPTSTIKRNNYYMYPFKKGFAVIASLLHEKETSVPITPIAITGAQKAWGIPGKIKVNIGRPVYPKDNNIKKLKTIIETKVKNLLIEIK